MIAPVFLRQRGARASRYDPHDSTIGARLELTHVIGHSQCRAIITAGSAKHGRRCARRARHQPNIHPHGA
jgi:hypothetical protein